MRILAFSPSIEWIWRVILLDWLYFTRWSTHVCVLSHKYQNKGKSLLTTTTEILVVWEWESSEWKENK